MIEFLVFGTIFAALLSKKNKVKSVKGVGTLGTTYVVTKYTDKEETNVICFNGADAKYQIDVFVRGAEARGYTMVDSHGYWFIELRRGDSRIVIKAKKASVYRNSLPEEYARDLAEREIIRRERMIDEVKRRYMNMKE